MDEATLDCNYCGRNGDLEFTLQRLSDDAAWRTVGRWVLCAWHAERLETRAFMNLDREARLMVMRCD